MLKLKQALAATVAASVMFTGFAHGAQATLIGTEAVARTAAGTPSGDHERIAALLARDDVRARLVNLGVDPRDADVRAASLTDAEAARLASALDTAPAGGDVLGVIVLIFFVLLVTDILGFTKVYPFTRSIR